MAKNADSSIGHSKKAGLLEKMYGTSGQHDGRFCLCGAADVHRGRQRHNRVRDDLRRNMRRFGASCVCFITNEFFVYL